MNSPRKRWELLETQIISEYGILSSNTKGRQRVEEESPVRTCFQRDVDRITHSKSFRRLKHKTQVFLQPEGDHYRTRLTHTLEVARIARTISRALGLNEDLTEAIALGHDIGHTPFGHAGERALNEIFKDAGFRHNEQSLRVVDYIELDGQGLNLSHETRMGIHEHSGHSEYDSIESKVVSMSDRIAYINHDFDDSMRAGIVTTADLPPIVTECIGTKYSARINVIVTDVIENSGGGILTMSPEMDKATAAFRDFMFEAVYYNPAAKSEESKVLDILCGIWEYYVNRPDKLSAVYRELADTWGLERAVCDYISGMTDKYAIYQYGQIFIPAAWQVL